MEFDFRVEFEWGVRMRGNFFDFFRLRIYEYGWMIWVRVVLGILYVFNYLLDDFILEWKYAVEVETRILMKLEC